MLNFLRITLILSTVLYCHLGYSQTVKSDSLVPYRIGNKWGYSNFQGVLLINPQYDEVKFFCANRAIVKKIGLYYLIDSKNKIIIKGCTKINLSADCNGNQCYKVMDNGNIYNVDINGKKVVKCGCEMEGDGGDGDGSYINPLIGDTIIGNEKLKYFVNDSSKTIYGDISEIFRNIYKVKMNKFYGLVYNNGERFEQLFETEYQRIDFFTRNEQQHNEAQYFIVKKNNKTALFNGKEMVIPYKFKSISTIDERRYILKVELQNGKTGYLNLNGFEYFKD